MKDFNPETVSLPPELQGRLFFTPKEFGALLGVHRATIFRWAAEGYLKMQKFSPRCSMVPKTELERFMRGEMMNIER
ncbi:MAG: helix-turn-helix domain-containing protein [Treponema sp.]|jgi:predicted site-specific integrase-resolvase|nr:helix-turn-helix domain-containing protein [Treponema sp.]